MMPEEELKVLEDVVLLTEGTPANVAKIFAAYRKVINPNASLCSTCSGSIRKAHQNLVQYYSLNKNRLLYEIKLNQLKKELTIEEARKQAQEYIDKKDV